MALITCPDCKKKISETAASCPNCGYQLTPEKIKKLKKDETAGKVGGFGCLTVIVVLLGLYFSGYFGSSDSKDSRKSKDSPSSSKSKAPPARKQDVVFNSGWDASVLQVKRWLKENLNDPDSLEFINWSPVEKTSDGGFMVRAKYRAKNGFGGYVVENQIFYMNYAGDVIRFRDF